MKYLLVCIALVAATTALHAPVKKGTALTDVFLQLEKIVNKFTDIAAHSHEAGFQASLSDLENRLQAIVDVLYDVFPGDQVEKRDNLIDKVAEIQDLLDKYVASVVNGTPLPPELVALGAEPDDPGTFISKIILMAAGHLGSRRDLLSVSKVI